MYIYNNIKTINLYETSKNLLKKKISSQELIKLSFEKIQENNSNLKGFIYINENSINDAIKSDIRRRRGKTLSLIDGIPIAIKDQIMTSNMPTTAGSKILENYVANYNATVIKKLIKSGAIILGKVNQDEFAMGSSNETSIFGSTKNPINNKKTTGGSSGGSAAVVASGICSGALGTDTGGSVRLPASFCGLTGMRPTYGRISRFGAISFASSLDQIGLITKNSESNAILLQEISGYDIKDSTSINQSIESYINRINKSIRGIRVGIPIECLKNTINSCIMYNFKQSINILKYSGSLIKYNSLSMMKYWNAVYYIIASAEAASNLSRYDGVLYGSNIINKKKISDSYSYTRGLFLGTEVQRRIILGNYVLSSDNNNKCYLQAQKIRYSIYKEFKEILSKVDVLLYPTAQVLPFNLKDKLKDPLKMYMLDTYTIGSSLAGLPSISINTGKSKNNLPIGMQLIGKPFSEGLLLQVAKVLESNKN